MKDLRIKPANAWDILFAASLIGLFAAIGFYFYAPKPVATLKQPAHFGKAIDQANSAATRARHEIEAKLWELNSEELGGSVLTHVGQLAEKHHVQVADFRIDKPISVSGQREAPFMVVLDGNFNDVMKVVSSIESSDSKLGLGLFQLAVSDRGPGFVKATLGVTAFIGKVG